MMSVFKKNLISILVLCTGAIVFGQSEPLVVQADSGVLGSDWVIYDVGGVRYISISTNGTAGYPENSRRVATYTVTFPDSGTYDLYARILVGAGNDNDDSYFYGNGFGVKDTINEDDWVRANNLSTAGYRDSADWVQGGGTVQSGIWKWLNMSEFTGDEAPVTFRVEEDNLTQTFQVGAREDGLAFDKFAFCKSDYYYSVYHLDSIIEGSPEGPVEPFIPTGPPIAEGKCKWLGNVHSNSQLPYFELYWNQVTPENAGKWGSVEPTRDIMEWGGLDAAYNFAKNNGFPFRLHVLIWGAQQPAWINALTPTEQLEEINEWFAAVAERYNDIDYLEVVNEPLHQRPDGITGVADYIDALGGSGGTGWDWILTAFQMAREHFPGTDLLINDYGIVSSTSATNDYLEIITLLKFLNLIDGIGVQAHAFNTGADAVSMTANLNLLAATGLPIYATEMDIDGPTDTIQLNDYKRIFPVFWSHPSVKGVTLWGYRIGMWRTAEGAYLLDEDGYERPAMAWLRNYVENSPTGDCTTDIPIITSENGEKDIIVFPNPAINGSFTIQGINNITNIKVLNMIGETIKEMNVSNLLSVDIHLNTASGMYLIQLSNGQNNIFKKILVE